MRNCERRATEQCRAMGTPDRSCIGPLAERLCAAATLTPRFWPPETRAACKRFFGPADSGDPVHRWQDRAKAPDHLNINPPWRRLLDLFQCAQDRNMDWQEATLHGILATPALRRLLAAHGALLRHNPDGTWDFATNTYTDNDGTPAHNWWSRNRSASVAYDGLRREHGIVSEIMAAIRDRLYHPDTRNPMIGGHEDFYRESGRRFRAGVRAPKVSLPALRRDW